MAGRCAEHGIALSPEGTCILCRRAEAPALEPDAPKRSFVPLAIVFALVLVSSAGLYFGIQRVMTLIGGAMPSREELREDVVGQTPPEENEPGFVRDERIPSELMPGSQDSQERRVVRGNEDVEIAP